MDKIIVKNKRKSKCKSCWKIIDGKYKVLYPDEYSGNTFHLSCWYNHILRQIAKYEKMKKQFTPTIKKHLILEKL